MGGHRPSVERHVVSLQQCVVDMLRDSARRTRVGDARLRPTAVPSGGRDSREGLLSVRRGAYGA